MHILLPECWLLSLHSFCCFFCWIILFCFILFFNPCQVICPRIFWGGGRVRDGNVFDHNSAAECQCVTRGAKKKLSLVTLNRAWFFGCWCLSFFLAHGWSKLSCLLVGISDGACGVSSMRWQWQYTVVHLALKVYLEMLIFCFGNDVASEELKGKNAQIVISRNLKTIMELMKIRWLTNVTLSLYQFADLIYLNAKGFREILFQGVNLLTKASTKFDID